MEKKYIRIKKSMSDIESLPVENLQQEYSLSQDVNKYKAGTEYTNNKVKVLRPVQQNGHVFQRNYWVDPRDVKPTDKVVTEGAGDDKTNFSTIQNLFLGTTDRTIKISTAVSSIKENVRNIENLIFEQLKESPFNDNVSVNTAEQIKKLALLESKLDDKDTPDEIKAQLLEFKKQIRDSFCMFFENAEKVNKIFPYLKDAIAKLHNDTNSVYPVDNYVPTWLDNLVEIRQNSNIKGCPKFNFNTLKLEVEDKEKFQPEFYNNALGQKIECVKPEIAEANKKFIAQRDLEFGLLGLTSTINVGESKPARIIPLKEVYPNIDYGDTEGWALDYIDPMFGKYYEKFEYTNIFSLGLQYFMKDSAFKTLMICDRALAEHIIGILISNSEKEKDEK